MTRQEAGHFLTWPEAVEAIRNGHLLPRPELGDLILGGGSVGLLNRAAHINGLGYAVKAETIFEANAAQGVPSVQGAVLLFDDRTGTLRAIIESSVVTQFKTVADSLLGASLLARPDARHLVIAGAGVVARDLVQGYATLFPDLDRISVWARNPEKALALVEAAADIRADLQPVADLPAALGSADIVASATMARDPILKGEWIRPGTHVDLIGGFKPEMREADDSLIMRSGIWVDCLATTVDRVGDLTQPIAAGVIGPQDVRGDLYDLVPLGPTARRSDDEVTLFKNGGGGHLDLIIASLIAQKLTAQASSCGG
ncbi:ornithine cyclodeaminase family protein [Paenirhodobacter populi]|uniref:ornithine cyclodeaminase family protein n=1 Tax=Paenirhodobacter populi TaxID=2306993 RepID=UPI001F4F1884|nr:ornithine cyclodeaminase [Sinirhodobacter populi]